jgi:phage shock protein PspC (stress-responsive transcriptional regulator)
MKTLRRSTTNRVIGGVCGGIAEYFNVDPVLIRLIFVILAIFGGAGIIAYIVALIIMPERSSSDNIQDADIVDDKKKTNNDLKKDLESAVEEVSKEFEKVSEEIEKEVKKHRHSSGAWFGIFLVFLGTVFLFRMLGWLHFSWCGIWNFWPLILIFIGVSCIPMKRWLKNTLMILCLTGLLIAMIGKSNSRKCSKYHHIKHHSTCHVNVSGGNILTLETSRNGENAELQIDVAAAKLTLSEVTEHLSEVWINGEKKSFVEFTNKIEQEDKFKFQIDNNQHINLLLNKNPIWDIELNVGAASVNMDFSAFKTKNIEINSGAADIDLTIGTKHPETNIEIETGASTIKIRIPKEADCKVITESVLMKKRLDGFVKSGRTYRTENFGSAAQTITIEIEGAVGNFEIIRY